MVLGRKDETRCAHTVRMDSPIDFDPFGYSDGWTVHGQALSGDKASLAAGGQTMECLPPVPWV